MINFVRSTIFNICFFGMTLAMCILYLPLLALPRQWYIDAVHFWVHIIAFLERTIMGITYEVRGAENLPTEGPYLIAAKHQSAYETFKLHILFDDPAIILKKELLRIPLWGMYLKKADVIAIDRGTPEKALRSIEDGAKRVAAQGRSIVIFPQGTRVGPRTTAEEKPYKPGVARVQEATGLPIIPMIVNSGVFWPRNSYMKKPGKVIFEFLEAIPAGMMDRKTLMKTLETNIESETLRIVNEGNESLANKRSFLGRFLLLILVVAAGLYSALWHIAEKEVHKAYQSMMSDLIIPARPYAPLKISGFPGMLTASIDKEYIQTKDGTLSIENLVARSWPFPLAPIFLKADHISVKTAQWREPLILDDFEAMILLNGQTLTILDSRIHKKDFLLSVVGTVDLSQRPFPKLDVEMALQNHNTIFAELSRIDALNQGVAHYAKGALMMLGDESGIVRVPIIQQNLTLYAGPLPVASLPDLTQDQRPAAQDNQPGPDQ